MSTRRAAIYVRQSQTHDETVSPEIQRKTAESFARQQGWSVLPTEYSDIDISGRTITNRPGLKKLRADFDKGLFDIAVAYDYSRFSRTLSDGADIVASMPVATAKEGEANPDDDFTPLLHLLLAHKFSRDMGKRWKEVHVLRASKGLQPTGQPQFGYDKQPDGTYVPNEYAPVLRKAYEDYISGKPFSKITEEWNKAGIPTSTGRADKWSFPVLIGTMEKKFYRGIIEFKGEEFPGVHEPIISEEVFAAFQAKRKERTKASPKFRHPVWPMSGLIECGACGGRVVLVARATNGPRIGCLTRRNFKACLQKSIYRSQADHALMLFLNKTLEEWSSLLPQADLAELDREVKEAEYRLTEAQDKLQAFIGMVADLGLSVEEAKSTLEERRKAVQEAKDALEAAQAKRVTAAPSEDVYEMIEHSEDLEPEQWSELLRTKLIEKCVLEPDQSFTIYGKNGESITVPKMGKPRKKKSSKLDK